MAGCPPDKQRPGVCPHGGSCIPGSPDPYGILYGPNCAFLGAGLGPFGSQAGSKWGPDWGPVLWQEHPGRAGDPPYKNRVTTRGPLARWAVGAIGPLGRWAVGPLGRWAVGPLGRWAHWAHWAHWSLVALVCWRTSWPPSRSMSSCLFLSTKTQTPKWDLQNLQ